MSIIEQVARAIWCAPEPEGDAVDLITDGAAYSKIQAAAAIAAFLEAAATTSDGWRMVPDEATEEMQSLISRRCDNPSRTYRAILSLAPKFKLDEGTP